MDKDENLDYGKIILTYSKCGSKYAIGFIAYRHKPTCFSNNVFDSSILISYMHMFCIKCIGPSAVAYIILITLKDNHI